MGALDGWHEPLLIGKGEEAQWGCEATEELAAEGVAVPASPSPPSRRAAGRYIPFKRR